MGVGRARGEEEDTKFREVFGRLDGFLFWGLVRLLVGCVFFFCFGHGNSTSKRQRPAQKNTLQAIVA